jgi:uncharacterized membrane protein
VFAAFRLYGLLPVGATFALMLVLIAGVGLLAVLQDALALAVLGLLAGFAAPILLSTGAGNHVVLFSYYALLNLAILAVAWVRPWRVLNLLGFFFTFAIGTAWGVLRYDPAQFASTEPFLVFHFLLYLAIPILFALRSAPMRAGAIDGTLVFGMPLIAFALQAGLLDGERLPLALSALALAVTYLVLAWALLRRVRLLGESFAVLAVGFATLAVPLAFSARVSGCVFARDEAPEVAVRRRYERTVQFYRGTADDLEHCLRQMPELRGRPLRDARNVLAMYRIEADAREAILKHKRRHWLGPVLRGLLQPGLRRKSAERALKLLLPRSWFGLHQA